MPLPALYYGTLAMAPRETLDEAAADVDRAVEILKEHAPELLPMFYRMDTRIPGSEARLRKQIA